MAGFEDLESLARAPAADRDDERAGAGTSSFAVG
jgi:hypothetical protein